MTLGESPERLERVADVFRDRVRIEGVAAGIDMEPCQIQRRPIREPLEHGINCFLVNAELARASSHLGAEPRRPLSKVHPDEYRHASLRIKCDGVERIELVF